MLLFILKLEIEIELYLVLNTLVYEPEHILNEWLVPSDLEIYIKQ